VDKGAVIEGGASVEKGEGIMVQNIIQTIPLDKLIAHPLNANRMSEAVFKKLLRNIERTGMYEPIVVRKHPEIDGSFQIINGHHRVKALVELGYETADCVIWDVDDAEAAVLLATLNRLAGSDVLDKRRELLNRLREDFGAGELAKLLPQTKKQIEALVNLKIPDVPSRQIERTFGIPLVFFVSDEQLKIINKALATADEKVQAETSAERKTKSLVVIAEEWMRGNIKNQK
jgi:ParB family transcriptional regulator, chromosome partitioning protein